MGAIESLPPWWLQLDGARPAECRVVGRLFLCLRPGATIMAEGAGWFLS
jgi:hypothetical protein